MRIKQEITFKMLKNQYYLGGGGGGGGFPPWTPTRTLLWTQWGPKAAPIPWPIKSIFQIYPWMQMIILIFSIYWKFSQFYPKWRYFSQFQRPWPHSKNTQRQPCRLYNSPIWKLIYIPICLVISFLKSAWRHSVYYHYDKVRNTPYFASWHLGDSLGVYCWPQCRYNRRFYKSHSRLSKITTGNRCRKIRTMQNVINRKLIEDSPPEIYVTWSDPRMTENKDIQHATYIQIGKNSSIGL